MNFQTLQRSLFIDLAEQDVQARKEVQSSCIQISKREMLKVLSAKWDANLLR